MGTIAAKHRKTGQYVTVLVDDEIEQHPAITSRRWGIYEGHPHKGNQCWWVTSMEPGESNLSLRRLVVEIHQEQPVPKGKLVKHKNGNSFDCRLENLSHPFEPGKALGPERDPETPRQLPLMEDSSGLVPVEIAAESPQAMIPGDHHYYLYDLTIDQEAQAFRMIRDQIGASATHTLLVNEANHRKSVLENEKQRLAEQEALIHRIFN